MVVKPKYKVGDLVWTYTRPLFLLGDAMAEKREIVDIEFNEDEDVVYIMVKLRGPFEYRFVEGRCFPTKEELLKSL